MCGICGIVYTGKSDNKVDEKEVRLMNDLMKHRGPDGEGFFVNESVGLGHRRLSIIDLSVNGSQPMSNEDNSIWITFNGEIYNYQELREELRSKHQFKSNSDTEVIIHGYEEWGVDILKKLRGQFAFGLYDSKNNKLFLTVDHIGQKPLYYYFNKEQKKFYFASEIKPILKSSKIERKINLEALHSYFVHNWRHIPHPHTIIENIYKLQPATFLILNINDGQLHIDNYWQADFTKTNYSEEKYISNYNIIAKQCVELVSVSDVPIAVSLSGGVDTSTIVALMNPPVGGLRTYSIGFDYNDPELERARHISKMFNTDHKEIIFNKESFGEMEDLIGLYGEPLNLLPVLHLYKICQEARKEVKVLIGGNGADEIFYGYDGTARLKRISLIYNLTAFIPRFVFRLLGFFSKTFRVFAAGKDKFKGEYYRIVGEQLKQNLYQPRIVEEIKNVNEGEIIDYYNRACDSPHLIEKGYYSGLMSENQHSVTIVADLAGMANSVEIRAPFLDHKMIEFASSLPLKFKAGSWFGRKYNKYIMKKSMEGTLPLEILYAPKMGLGYNIKIGKLISGEWRGKTENILFNILPKANIFNLDFIKEKFEEHLRGGRDNSALLWGLVVFGIWYKNFLQDNL